MQPMLQHPASRLSQPLSDQGIFEYLIIFGAEHRGYLRRQVITTLRT